jgi:hypothetical protein
MLLDLLSTSAVVCLIIVLSIKEGVWLANAADDLDMLWLVVGFLAEELV